MKFSSKYFAAPMVGVSDTAFRIMCRKYGAGLTFTEMTYVASLARGIDKVKIDRRREKSVGIQLAGTNLEEIKAAVDFIDNKVDVYDYNLGCPVNKAQRQKVGAILMEDPNLVKKVLSKLVSSTNKPVFAKIRSGFKSSNINYETIAKIAQDVGCSALTIHPRTAEKKRTGAIFWEHIRDLKEKLNIPVIANGDIFTPEDANYVLNYSNCDYIMLARAAARDPTIFKQCIDFDKKGKYKSKDKIKLSNEYFKLIKKYPVKFKVAKEHINYFIKYSDYKHLTQKINKSKDIKELKSILKK